MTESWKNVLGVLEKSLNFFVSQRVGTVKTAVCRELFVLLLLHVEFFIHYTERMLVLHRTQVNRWPSWVPPVCACILRQRCVCVCVCVCVCPRVGPGHPSFPLVLPHLMLFLHFPFFHWLYLFSSFVHPFPFYQSSPTPFPLFRPEVVWSDRTWV